MKRLNLGPKVKFKKAKLPTKKNNWSYLKSSSHYSFWIECAIYFRWNKNLFGLIKISNNFWNIIFKIKKTFIAILPRKLI